MGKSVVIIHYIRNCNGSHSVAAICNNPTSQIVNADIFFYKKIVTQTIFLRFGEPSAPKPRWTPFLAIAIYF